MSRLEELQEIRKAQKETLECGLLRETKARQARLGTLYQAMKKWEPQLLEAMQADLGKPPFESYIAELVDGLWGAPGSHSMSAQMEPSGAGKDGNGQLSVPGLPFAGAYGHGPDFLPVELPGTADFGPADGGFGGGMPLCAEIVPVFCQYLPGVGGPCWKKRFPGKRWRYSREGPGKTPLLLEQKWDTIFFTGSPKVGRGGDGGSFPPFDPR